MGRKASGGNDVNKDNRDAKVKKKHVQGIKRYEKEMTQY